jgi:N-acetylmuramoyl-L-alanine amidase
MSARMKLTVLLGLLFLAAPVLGAARTPPAPPALPSSAVSLRDWAAKHRLPLSYDPKSKAISLKNRWAEVNLLHDSRRASINGINVWLSFPIQSRQGRLLIHRKDLTTLIEPILYPKRAGQGRKIRVIALDAGHGGRDPGFQIGPHQEKKYTLLLAKELQELLEDAGFKTVLTRRSDTYVERGERADLAQEGKADLFVSLHYNCAPDPAAKGVETYAVTPFGAESTNGGEIALRAYPGNRFDAQSVLLAFEVQRSITRSLDMEDRGVRRAAFEVLRKAPMPSILIEGGFMSNSADGRKVFNQEHRKEMARAIADGILAYKRVTERTAERD